jgi:UDP-3-O-[3-hydroxymyristoyl] glucosamine N-acyltransferase
VRGRQRAQGDGASRAGEAGGPGASAPESPGASATADAVGAPGAPGAAAEATTRRLSARQIAALTQGQLVGAPDVTVSGVAPLDRAGPDDLSFLAARRYLQYFQRSSAAIVLCKPDLVAEASAGPACRVLVRDPHVALLAVIPVLYPQPAWEAGIHRTAVLGAGVVWQEPVAIGPYAVLGRGVRLGRNVRIGAGAVLGDGVELGDDAQVFPQVVCYSGTIVGRRVILHAGVRLGSDGFGYVASKDGQPPRKIPQVGRCIIGDDVEIGANTTIDRGSVDDTVVGPGTKIDNLVQIGHNCRIGARCLIAGQAGIAGSTHVEDDVFLAGQAGLADHVTIGRGARVTVQGGVIGDIDPGATVSGYPARPHREFLRAQGALYRLAQIVDDLETLVRRTNESQR